MPIKPISAPASADPAPTVVYVPEQRPPSFDLPFAVHDKTAGLAPLSLTVDHRLTLFSNPLLDIALRRAGLSDAQITTLFESLADEGKALPKTLRLLPAALNAAVEAGLSPAQITYLFTRVTIYVESTFRALPRALSAAAKNGFAQDQITDLFGRVLGNYAGYPDKVLDSLPAAFDAFTRYSVPPDRMIVIIDQILTQVRRAAEGACYRIPAMLDAAAKTGLPFERVPLILAQVSEETGQDAWEAFRALSFILEALITVNFPLERIPAYIGSAAHQQRGYVTAQEVFAVLPSAIRAGLSDKETSDLVGKVVRQAGRDGSKALRALPAGLAAARITGLSQTQISDLVTEYPIDQLEWALVNGNTLLAARTPEGAALQSVGLVPTLALVAQYTPGIETLWRAQLDRVTSGQERFDPKNPLHVELVYTSFHNDTRLKFSNPDKYTYTTYKEVIASASNDAEPAPLSVDQAAELVYAGYESFRLYEYLQELKEVAVRQGRRVLVVPNYSYGRFVVEPLEKYLRSDPVFHIVGARIGSTESHDDEFVLHSAKADRIFDEKTERMILEEQPIIVMVDGSNSFNDGQFARYPDAQKGYVNYAIGLNAAMGVAQGDMKRDDEHIEGLKGTEEYRKLQARLAAYPVKKEHAQPYSVHYWNPAGTDLAISEGHHAQRQATEVASAKLEDIQGPAMIVVNAVFNDGHKGVFLPDWVRAMGNGAAHKSAYFDDSHHIQNIIFKVGARGIEIQDEIYGQIRDQFRRFAHRELYDAVAETGLVSEKDALKLRLHRLRDKGDDQIRPELVRRLSRRGIALDEVHIDRLTQAVTSARHAPKRRYQQTAHHAVAAHSVARTLTRAI